jgi:hypothetical protein
MNKTVVALFSIALGGIFASEAGAREPTPIKACGTIDQPGSYELVNNLTTNSDCLVITANFVTIDLAGFTISGPGSVGNNATAITANMMGVAVRNGSIAGFNVGVALLHF